MKEKNTKEKGVILLLFLLIIGVTSFIFFFALSRSSLNIILDSDERVSYLEAREHLFGCMNEAIINLQFNNDFNTSSLYMVDYVCNLSIVSSTETKIVNVSTTVDNIIRGLEFEIRLSPDVVVEKVEEKLF